MLTRFTIWTFAAFAMAPLAATKATKPFVSTYPIASMILISFHRK
jgi:hypothetical protein